PDLPSVSLFLQCVRHPPDLHSFPTRRSSDLLDDRLAAGLAVQGAVEPELHPREAAIVDPGEPEHLRGEPALWIGASQSRPRGDGDRKSTRLNSSHVSISYAVFCLKKKKKKSI